MQEKQNNSSMSDFFSNCYAEMHEGEVIVSYKGAVTSKIIADTLELVETKLDEHLEPCVVRKKLYNVLVECLQNLFHHVDNVPNPDSDTDKLGAFVLSKTNEGYRISTGNMVEAAHSENLKLRIDKINGLSKEELKEFYKFVLNNQTFSAKGGGGLGLIDIARKTGNPIDYKLIPFGDELYFFNMNVLING